MPMKLPKAASDATAIFEAIRPTAPAVSVRLLFGQPAAFVAGNMFLGVFGDAVFLRLSEGDRAEATRASGARPFEPMPGRPMREYVVLSAAVLRDPEAVGRWVARSLEYTSGLPPKAKAKGSGTARGSRRPAAR